MFFPALGLLGLVFYLQRRRSREAEALIQDVEEDGIGL
ncbi:MAG: hypothetical protein MI747_21740 [Desulfobacterales bacterium]|nr:hypothetical protein [Desulfobacterales bacterium]